MANVINFEIINPNCAGIDIGAKNIFVSTDGKTVESYETFTGDYLRCVNDLQAKAVKRVAMEATGVYWMALYELLEKGGVSVCLVHPKYTKQLKGQKTDPKDSRWIQRVFAAGLLKESYVPSGLIKAIRLLTRERQDVIEMGSAYVNKMQKHLEQMNIKLKNVIAQIHGVSGIKMIEAIISGERDAKKILMLCDVRIIKDKKERVLKALEGNYNETNIYLLAQNLKMWKQHQEQIAEIDKKIEEVLIKLSSDKPEITPRNVAKQIRHHKPKIKELNKLLLKIFGVDMNNIPGVNDYTLLRLLGETGIDMSRFPTEDHFASWCQLAPRWNQSGQSHRKVRMRNGSIAGQIFRESAQAMMNSKNIAIGAFIKRLIARKGAPIAIKAGARKIALVYYNLLTKGGEYVEKGVEKYQKQQQLRERRTLEKLAQKYNLKLIVIQCVA
jgi:transposase